MNSSEDKGKAPEDFEIDDGATAVDGDQPEKDKQQQQQQQHEQQEEQQAQLQPSNSTVAPVPSQVNYVRGSGFDRDAYDGTTLVEGEVGSSSTHASNNINGFQSFSQTSHNEQVQSHLQQLHYNNNRIALDRSINTANDILFGLKTENEKRPVYYPTNLDDGTSDSKLNSRSSRLALIRQSSVVSSKSLAKQEAFDDSNNNNNTNTTDLEEPYSFEILKINLKIDPASGENVLANLDKQALSSLLSRKLLQIERHLSSLKLRIDDTSSKVLVTGDLNSGKSAFCNALLRKKVLPEDQQPCTNVFCEVIDARENRDKQEVHAIPIGCEYDINDERTYKIFPLKELENIVYESETYKWIIVYVNDNRPIEHSLLKNGVIDIKLIDAPGLNLDSYHTTQVFSRQEEIDLVIFVVNAENHFTLSGREFLASAATDKNLLFIVVNKFDSIKKKDRCKQIILDQVKGLSPDTHKDANEFVHFVSSQEVLNNLPGGGDGDGPDGGDGGDGGPDDGAGDNNDPDYDSPEFDHLEASLRRFVLEKRSMSKLYPAKNYLLKLYKDLLELCSINEKLYNNDKEKLNKELKELQPQYDSIVSQSNKINEKINKIIENTWTDVYNYSRRKINESINNIDNNNDEINSIIKFNGFSTIGSFAEDIQEFIYDRIIKSVEDSEDYSRNQTSISVDKIKSLGNEILPNDNDNDSNNSDVIKLPKTKFNSNSMYTRRKDNLQRHLNNEIDIFDFIDPNYESFCKIFNINFLPNPKILFKNFDKSTTLIQLLTTSASGLIIYSLPKLINILSNFISISNILPKFITKYVIPSGLSIGIIGIPIYYFYKDMPFAYKRNITRRIKEQIEEEDYQHNNSSRIAKECRKVLIYPARDINNCLQNLLDNSASKRKKIIDSLKSSELSFSYYKKLREQVNNQKKLIDKLNLENID